MKIVIFLSVLVIAATSAFEMVSPDLFWHLKMGDDFLFHGLSPFVDHYSFTLQGHAIHGVAWPFQVLMALFFKLGGFKGIAIFRFLNWLAGLYLLLRICRFLEIRAGFFAFGVTFFLFALIFHSEPRPDLLSETLELLIIYLMLPLLKEKNWKLIIGVAFIFFFWSNYHLSSVIGYVVAGAFVATGLLQAIVEKKFQDLRFWTISGLMIILSGFINHDLQHPILAQFGLSPQWQDFITEYASRPFQELEWPLKVYWVTLLLSIPGMILEKNIPGLIIISILGWKAWSMSKLFPHLILCTLPFVLSSYQHLTDRFLNQKKSLAVGFMLACLIFPYDVYYSMVRPLHPLNGSSNAHFFPTDVMDYMKTEKISGRIFNEYGPGGYVIFHGSPETTVYIDGRTAILYPIEFFKKFAEAATHPKVLTEEAHKYNIQFVLAEAERPGEILETALESDEFALEYFGEKYALLKRGEGRFSKTSEIFVHPECLANNISIYDLEIKIARSELQAGSPLKQFLNVLFDYENALDKKSLFSTPHPEWTQSTYVSRLAAELAKRQNQLQMEMYYLSEIPFPNADDTLRLVELQCRLNACQNGEILLDKINRSTFRPDQLPQYLGLLKEIDSSQGLKIFNKARIERIKNRIDRNAVAPAFCHLRATASQEEPKGIERQLATRSSSHSSQGRILSL